MWGATTSASWLTVSPNSGVGSGVLTVGINTAGLTAQTYTGAITVTASGGTNSPQTISVVLTVNPAPASISLSARQASFSYTLGGSAPASQTVNITNGGGGTLAWSATSGASWLTVSPNSGVGSGVLTVGINTAGLTAQTYTGAVTVTASGATNSPQTVSVVLNVAPPSASLPSPTSVNPAFGSGASQTFAFVFSDTAAYQNLSVLDVLINNFLDGRHACYLAYVLSSNTLVLVDDDGDAGGPYAGSVALGSQMVIQNSQCAVGLTSAIGSGNTLTVTLSMTFKSAFAGNRIVYMAAQDNSGANSGWQALGTWGLSYTPAGSIAVVSLTPASAAAPAGTAQTLTAMLTDSKGAGDFGVVNLLVNKFIDGRQACYLAYAAASNSLLLVDDAGDAGGPFAGNIVLNGGGAIQNSQCAVSGIGSSAQLGGNTLILTLNITFKSAFTGNRIVWVAGRDVAGGSNTDWQAVGTTTVQ
jgi:ABC-type arginine/histidine transport system permease subunit